MLTVTGRDRVNTRESTSRAITARNLPMTMYVRFTGSVRSSSKVPLRCSSLHWRIVNVATRKIIRTGIHRNNGRTSATFLTKKVSTQKKMKRLAARKTPMKMRARGEPKYARSSLRETAQICTAMPLKPRPRRPLRVSCRWWRLPAR